VIARSFFLLVARFLFLIHNHEPQIFERSENRRTRPDHHASLAAPHAPPFARALNFTERAVKHRNVCAKPSPAKPSHPQGQRDFRHQNQRRFVAREDRLDSPQIHLGLAAAGDAIQQAHAEHARFEPASDFAQRALLIGVKNVRRWRVIDFEEVFFDGQRLFPAFQFSCADETLDQRSRDLREFRQRRQRQQRQRPRYRRYRCP